MTLIATTFFLPKATHMPCGGGNNTKCLTDIISTDTTYPTCHEKLSPVEQAEIQLLQICAFLVSG